jgi:hypothetical protein
MYQAVTKPTEVSVASYLAAIEDVTRRADCEAIAALMQRVTRCAPALWGPSIVGFDSYHYRYASGHQGDASVVAFASRKGDISIYLMCDYESPEVSALLAQLGKHKVGKSCLYIKRLSDIQMAVLEQLMGLSVAETRRRYPRPSESSGH